MQLIIKNFTGNPAAFMRSKGYALHKKQDDELSFIRRITGQEFPRFHAYVQLEKAKEIASPRNDANESSRSSAKRSRNLIINLHLDQKRPTYESGAAHAGEYDGELIKEESERLSLTKFQAT